MVGGVGGDLAGTESPANPNGSTYQVLVGAEIIWARIGGSKRSRKPVGGLVTDMAAGRY